MLRRARGHRFDEVVCQLTGKQHAVAIEAPFTIGLIGESEFTGVFPVVLGDLGVTALAPMSSSQSMW